MTHKIPYQGREQRKRKLSRSARRAMAESGRKNIIAWLEKRTAEADAIRSDVGAFREQVFAELGQHLTATRKALAQTAIATYESILRVNYQLSRKRPKNVALLAERVSWLSGTMLRTLKLLNLDARPRPRTLADVARQVQPQNEQNKPSDGQK